jgi:hypothetical protein
VLSFDGARLLSVCRLPPEGNLRACYGAVRAYYELLADHGQICPRGAPMSWTTVEIVLRHLTRHPEARQRPVVPQARAALAQAFPCR